MQRRDRLRIHSPHNHELLVLPLQTTAPATPQVSFQVLNSSSVVRTLRHADPLGTLFAEFSFPAGSLASLGGQSIGPGDSLLITVSALEDNTASPLNL
ncbi:MAG: hypothetical protein V3R24_00620 [Gemmatimonadales bacterium]